MKQLLFFAGFFLLACEEPAITDIAQPLPVSNTTLGAANLPDKIVGSYVLDNATLNGPKFEVIVSANPETSVVYLPNSDITDLVRKIVFRGGGEVSFVSLCNEAQQAIEFKPNGRTSHSCLGANMNKTDMGFWNTTGADDALLAWSIMHDREVIECEISPYEVNSEKLSGFLVFPLPTNALMPVLEGDNHQYRKIKIVLRKI